VYGLGPLSEYGLAVEAHALVAQSPSGSARLPLGHDPGELRSIVLTRVPLWPVAWIGWGPAWVCDLRFEDPGGEALLTLPAGGGWQESVTRVMRYGLWFGPERRRRLVAGWSRSEVEDLLRGTGVSVLTTDRPPPKGRRNLRPGLLNDATWLASAR
jgi:hypothetical protein